MPKNFNKTTCVIPNAPLPNITQVVNYIELDRHNDLWKIYLNICFNQFIKNREEKNANEKKYYSNIILYDQGILLPEELIDLIKSLESDTDADNFSQNYSLFLQSLFISLIKSLDKNTIDDKSYKIYELLFNTDPLDFFLGNKNKKIFFRDHSNDTILTSMIYQKSNDTNVADLFERLLQNSFISFSSETFIDFISSENHLGMSALLIAIQLEKEDFLVLLLKYIKKIILKNPNYELYDLFFNKYFITSSNETYSLINKSIMTNNNRIFSILIDGIEGIYGIKNHYYLKFINSNLPTSPIILTLILSQEKNFYILVNKAIIVYENQLLKLINYLTQKELFKKNNILEIVSLQHLIIKLNNRSKNIEILNKFLINPIDKSIIDQLDDNRANNKKYLFNITDSLINTLLNYSDNNDVIFDYFTISNSKGEIFLHLIDNDDVIDDDLLVHILDKLKFIFHADKNKFLKIINYRDFRGLTPFLVASSSKEKDKFCNIFIGNYPVDIEANPYYHIDNDTTFFRMNYIQADSQTYGNIINIDQLKKESIFSLFTYLFQNVDAQALNARVQEIKYNKPDLLQLDQEEEAQIDIYQKSIDIFYNYTLVNNLPLSKYYEVLYISDSVDVINSTLTELFINNQYQYVLLHKTHKDTLLIVKRDINYYFFSHGLFSPMKKFCFTYMEGNYYIASWIKKYFFIDNLGSQSVTLYPFNFYKNSSNAEFSGIYFNENVNNYRDRLNELNLTIIITDKMFLEKKILGLPIKFIQELFNIDNIFINIEKFKDNKENFFDLFYKKLSFRSERMEDYFFRLSNPERISLQSILKAYPNISYEKHDKYFKVLQEIQDYIKLQQLFLECYGELILSTIRLENFNITQWGPYDINKISLNCYEKSVDTIQSDFISESKKHQGKRTFLHFLYQEKIKPLIANVRRRERRQANYWNNFLFPTLSSLPYGIKVISKISVGSLESAVNDLFIGIAPWADLVKQIFIDDVIERLPIQVYSRLRNLKEECFSCDLGLSKIFKNFPMFSIAILTISILDTVHECNSNNKDYTITYCINMIANIIGSYFIAALDIKYPVEMEQEMKYSAAILVILITHGATFESYHQYNKITDLYDLHNLQFHKKSYIMLNTVLGSINYDNFNYATIGIESKDLIFSAFEKFIDEHAKTYNLDYKYVAISIPNVEDKYEKKILESGKVYPIFKIKELPNFEFVFTKNTTYCHDLSGIKITPDHEKNFTEEYDISIGTFVSYPGPKERKCSNSELITTNYLAKASYNSKAVILFNILPELKRTNLVLSSTNYLFGLIDPSTFNNYTWTFLEDYQGSSSRKELIGFIVKRIIPLTERETPNIARIKITGRGLVRPDVVKNIYSINFGIYSSSIGKKSELFIEPSVDTPIKQLFGFPPSLFKDIFYFNGNVLINKKGLSIINLDQVKNLHIYFSNHYYTTENLIIFIPCNKTFMCSGGVANATHPFRLSRLACDYKFYHTKFYFELMPNTQFTYNNILKFTVGDFDIGTLYMGGLLKINLGIKEEFKLSDNINFDQITIIPSIENLILKFNLDNTTAIVYIELKESTEYLDIYSYRIGGYLSKENKDIKWYLEFSKNKGQVWRTKLATTELTAKNTSISTIESMAIDINKNNNYDIIMIRKYFYYLNFYFVRENNIVITGDFNGYNIDEYNNKYEYKINITEYYKENSTIIFLNKKIDLIVINNVSYFINFEAKHLLAINIIGELTKNLIAPLRITDTLENYSRMTPLNSFPKTFIKLLQFDNELVSLRYFNYYQFFKKIDNIQVSKLTQEKFEVDINQNSKIEEFDISKRFKPIIIEEAVTSSATRSESWLSSFFKYLLKIKIDFKAPFFDLDLPKNPKSKKYITLDHCTLGVVVGDIYREEGFTCYSKNIKVIILPKESTAKMATSYYDTYSKPTFRLIEFNGHPSVYFEDDKTNVFYMPEILVNPLDQFNDQLVLLQVLLHEGKKVYHWFNNFFNSKSDQSKYSAQEYPRTLITNQIKKSWKESLKNIEKQLCDINKLARGKVDTHWIKYILEDRKEEFKYLNQITEQNSDITRTFTKNLKALQLELVEIKENLFFMQKKDNTYNLNYKKGTLLSYRSNPCFFNTYKENLRIEDFNVLGLNPRSSELNLLNITR